MFQVYRPSSSSHYTPLPLVLAYRTCLPACLPAAAMIRNHCPGAARARQGVGRGWCVCVCVWMVIRCGGVDGGLNFVELVVCVVEG